MIAISYISMDFKEKTKPKRSHPNYLYAIIGVALVLYLIGFFGLIVLNGQSLVNSYKEKMNIMVEIKNDVPGHEVLRLRQELERADYTKAGAVKFITKKEAAETLAKDFGDEFASLGFSNPLYDVINFSTKAVYVHPDSLASIKTELKNNAIISEVFYQEGLVDNIEQNVKKIGFITLVIGILFIFVAITLIHNTIKLALYSNRFLIKNMELVGATWGFISKPFLLKSIKNGFLSSILAMVLLIITIFFIKTNLIELESLFDPTLIGILFFGILLLGLLISGTSTYYIVNKYLRMRLDDLY